MRQKTAYNQINKTVENNTCKMYNSTVDGWKKMKPYWTGLFLIALFMQVYTAECADDTSTCKADTDNNCVVTLSNECDVAVSGISITFNTDTQFVVCKRTSKFITCDSNNDHCVESSTMCGSGKVAIKTQDVPGRPETFGYKCAKECPEGYNFLQDNLCVEECAKGYNVLQDNLCVKECATDELRYGTQCVAKCPAGSFQHNKTCISCADATGEERATSKEGATGMNDCYLPAKSNNTPNQYIDEKGTFTYSSDCTISCTDETSYLCDNASA